MPIDIILASASPRRKQLLEEAGVKFMVRVSPVDETLGPELEANPYEAVQVLAERKAGVVVQEVLAVAENYQGTCVVMGADTMVVLGNEIFGKPRDIHDAKRMLRRLSGCTHEVMTAVSVWVIMAPEPGKTSVGKRTFVDKSTVTFRDLTDEQIAEYLKKGESFDKAGAYAIQGHGAELVEETTGALDTIIGMPIGRLLEEFPDLRSQN